MVEEQRLRVVRNAVILDAHDAHHHAERVEDGSQLVHVVAEHNDVPVDVEAVEHAQQHVRPQLQQRLIRVRRHGDG